MNMETDNKMARVAGALYLLYIVSHVFADVIGRSQHIVGKHLHPDHRRSEQEKS